MRRRFGEITGCPEGSWFSHFGELHLAGLQLYRKLKLLLISLP
jgi:hypothetical protein